MKRILGLDLGTNSIGWAYVHEAEHEHEASKIIDLGVRVVPLASEETKAFEKGKKGETANAKRRTYRSARRNLQRYKLRRRDLIKRLLDNKLITPDSPLAECGKDTTFETLRLRALAATEQISLEAFARVLLLINKKRGYQSNRICDSSEVGKGIDNIEIARELHDQHLTPGQWIYRQTSLKRLPDFYRSDLLAELRRVWHEQAKHHPRLSTDQIGEIEKLIGRETLSDYLKGILGESAPIKGTKDQKLQQQYSWRNGAASQRIELDKLHSVISAICSDINRSSDYLGKISDRSKELLLSGQTIGQYLYTQLQANPHARLRGQIFYRQDYLKEFECIWSRQAGYYPETLTPALKRDIRDAIIFYQRPLKSQKGLISICELEGKETERERNGKKHTILVGPRAIPCSSPLFQEFRIWQQLGHVRIRSTDRLNEALEERLSTEQKQQLFEELNIKGDLSAKDALAILGCKSKDKALNYTKLEGNRTNQRLYSTYLWLLHLEGHSIPKILDIRKKIESKDKICLKDSPLRANEIKQRIRSLLETIGVDSRILDFDACLEGKAFRQQASHHLWHLLYSYRGDKSVSGNDRLYKALKHHFGFSLEQAKVIVSDVSFSADYGRLSAKAIRRIYPHLRELQYSEACERVGYRHSKSSLTTEENDNRPLLDSLPILPKNSLRQPVVEKIINQMIQLVNTLVSKHSQYDNNGEIVERLRFDEIRIELARELKQSASERAETLKEINKNEKLNQSIIKELQESFPEFRTATPSRNDIIRYRLYKELEPNGYKDLYRGKLIPKEHLFTPDIQVEHIIPKALVFDNSFANKTLAFHEDNLRKKDRTAYDYIASDYTSELELYEARINDLHKSEKISDAKYRNLLKRGEDVGDGFIERDLRQTQYIARKAREILRQITRVVVPTSGKITARLREDWGLTDIMKELNIGTYSALGLTERQERKDGRSIEVIKGWSKRDDHRHHAMDALTIAFTRQSHIHYLNHLNARKDEQHKLHQAILGIQRELTITAQDGSGRGKRIFREPMPNFRAEALKALGSILVSYKAKNKAVTTSYNRAKSNDPNRSPQKTLTPRSFLHKETIYGRRLWPRASKVVLSKLTLESIDLIIDEQERRLVRDHLLRHGGDIKQAFSSKTLKASPLLHRGEPLEAVACFEEIFTIRKPISPDLTIENVLDKGIQEVLRTRLSLYGGDAKKAFSDLDTNPIWLNKKAGIAIKSVTIRTTQKPQAIRSKRDNLGRVILKDGCPMPADYVELGNNHHVAIYIDDKGELHEQVVSFLDAVSRAISGLPLIDREYKRGEGWRLLFTLKQNEVFVFPNTGFDPKEIDLCDPAKKAEISRNLFRVQKVSKGDYWFRHHLETTVNRDTSIKATQQDSETEVQEQEASLGAQYEGQEEKNKEGKNPLKEVVFKRITKLSLLKDAVKVRINHLGDIISIGEY